MFKALILNRMREPSTYAGIAALVGMFGLPIGVPVLVAQVVAGIGGMLAIFLSEKPAA